VSAKNPMNPDTLRQLVEKWREEADGVTAMGYSQQGDRMRDCADELSTLLTEAEAPSHRCSGCGHRWSGELKGAELCGDCWRKGQAVIHGAEAERPTISASIAGYSEWWVCFPCWKSYHVPTTGFFGKCDCGRDTVRWPGRARQDAKHDGMETMSDQTTVDTLQALVEQWHKDADEADSDGDFCCALTRRNDAIDLSTLLAEAERPSVLPPTSCREHRAAGVPHRLADCAACTAEAERPAVEVLAVDEQTGQARVKLAVTRAKLEEALQEMLSFFPNAGMLDILDDGNRSGIRPCAMVRNATIGDVRRWHEALRAHLKGSPDAD
jgi:hypothetical protein